MAKQSIARTTIGKARFFLDCAEAATPNQREAFCNNLEAAIVFARSITFHLQKEFADQQAFKEWYAIKQQVLSEDRLACFLLEQRNYILKEGPVATSHVVELSVMIPINISCSATLKVIRGAPWYRRSFRILFRDAIYPIRSRWHDHQQRRREAVARAARASGTPITSQTRDQVYFSESEWRATPAVELVRLQLLVLESILNEAEARFPRTTDGREGGDTS